MLICDQEISSHQPQVYFTILTTKFHLLRHKVSKTSWHFKPKPSSFKPLCKVSYGVPFSLRTLLYLPMYKSIPCIGRAPILEPKNKFFLSLGKNFLEKLIFYLRIFFEVCNGYMKKITASLDIKFIIAHT